MFMRQAWRLASRP